MKGMKCTAVAVIATSLFIAGSAYAEVTGITMRFAGGCTSTNTTGSCTIKATASGTDLSAESLSLQKSTTGSRGNYRNFGYPRVPTDSGYASWKFKNDPSTKACYRVKDVASNVRSRELCIK